MDDNVPHLMPNIEWQAMQVNYMRISMDDSTHEPKETRKSYRYFNPLCVVTVIIVVGLYIGGVFTLLFEEDFSKFNQRIGISNYRRLIDALDRNGPKQMWNSHFKFDRFGTKAISQILSKMDLSNGGIEKVVPLDQFEIFEYLIDVEQSCQRQWSQSNLITIIIIVKSAVTNFDKRSAIRQTWYLNRTVDDLIQFKTVFTVGSCKESAAVPITSRIRLDNDPLVDSCTSSIHEEASHYGDIVQSSAIDDYYNNTLKTVMTLRWVVERCQSDFLLYIDDDYVFEVENFVEFLKKQASMESINTGSISSDRSSLSINDSSKGIDHELDFKPEPSPNRSDDNYIVSGTINNLRALSDQFLYTGYLRNYVRPMRALFTKWYVPRSVYPYSRYPPFITGGLVLMSSKSVRQFYLSTYFTPSFIYDDVYIGMSAYKLGYLPEHHENFMCDIDDYLAANPTRANSTKCIGVTPVGPKELIELWRVRNQQVQ